jgi:hypothetical protein
MVCGAPHRTVGLDPVGPAPLDVHVQPLARVLCHSGGWGYNGVEPARLAVGMVGGGAELRCARVPHEGARSAARRAA